MPKKKNRNIVRPEKKWDTCVHSGVVSFIQSSYCSHPECEQRFFDVLRASSFNIEKIFGDTATFVTMDYREFQGELVIMCTVDYKYDFYDQFIDWKVRKEYSEAVYECSLELDAQAWQDFAEEMGGYDVSGYSPKQPRCMYRQNFH